MQDDDKKERKTLQEIIHQISIEEGVYTDPQNEPIDDDPNVLEIPRRPITTAPNNKPVEPVLEIEEPEIGIIIPITHIDLSRVFPEQLFGPDHATTHQTQPIFQK